MAISFKDVGVKKEERDNDVLTRNRTATAIGIKTPLELDTFGKELLSMHFSVKDQIKDNLKNLLLTNHGERVAQYSFGANLRELVSEYSNKDNFDTEAMLRINTSISRWMPFVNPIEFDSSVAKERSSSVGKLRIMVIYAVPALNISRDQLELEITVI